MIEKEIEYTAFVQEDTEDGMEKVLDLIRLDVILSTPWTMTSSGSLARLNHPTKYCWKHSLFYDYGECPECSHSIGGTHCPCPQCRDDQIGSMTEDDEKDKETLSSSLGKKK